MAFGAQWLRKNISEVNPLIDWIRKMVVKHSVTSIFGSMVWKGLMASFPWIYRWLMWKVGNSFHIQLGKDSFLGGLPYCFYYEPLINSLDSKGFFVLGKPFSAFPFDYSKGNWLSTSELAFHNDVAPKWDRFVTNMSFNGVTMSNERDELVWTQDKYFGKVETKSFYMEIATSCQAEDSWWHSLIWKWNLPAKLKTLLWVVLKNKILTWDNLQKMGFHGPNFCKHRTSIYQVWSC